MTNANTNVIAKVAAVVAVLGLVAMSFAPAAKAAETMTTTTTTTMTAAPAFTMNQTMGSKGSEVTALQNWLIGKGYTIAAGATGYFGAQTKAALASYQSAKGISPAVGYFGSVTRASVNAMGGAMTSMTPGCVAGAMYSATTGAMCAASTTTMVPGCVAGAMFSSTTGAKCGTTTTTTSTTGITTIGVEGTINVEKESANVKTTVYEGDSKVKVLGVRIEAKNSDVNFSRIRVSLGTTTDTYVKQFSRVYLMDDAGNTLASQDLNSSSVTRVSGTPATYYVTLSGFNYTIKKDMKKSFYIAYDAYNSISSQYRTGSQTISLYGEDAIRVTDGAGIEQYSVGAQNISQTFNISASLTDSATLTVSTDPAVRKATTIVADKGANNDEKDAEEIGSFRLLAEKDSVLLRDLNVTVATSSNTGGVLQTLYLYDGSTAVGTASGVNGVYSFTSVNQTLTKDVYKTYTLKADFRSVTSGQTFDVTGVNVTSAESVGSGRTITVPSLGTGAGETMIVVAKGVSVTLSTPTLSITAPKDNAGVTNEAHVSAGFNVNLMAVGSDATFGTAASAFTFVLLKNGVVVATSTKNASTSFTAYYPATVPTGIAAGQYNQSTGFTLTRNGAATVLVTFKVDSTTSTAVAADLPSADYTVRLNTITYTTSAGTVSNDYSTNANYVTPTVTRP